LPSSSLDLFLPIVVIMLSLRKVFRKQSSDRTHREVYW
jgi:hypothetical protein